MDIFKDHYDDPVVWFNRWRIFFLTCEVFFAMNKGEEYFVSHYLFEKLIHNENDYYFISQ